MNIPVIRTLWDLSSLPSSTPDYHPYFFSSPVFTFVSPSTEIWICWCGPQKMKLLRALDEATITRLPARAPREIAAATRGRAARVWACLIRGSKWGVTRWQPACHGSARSGLNDGMEDTGWRVRPTLTFPRNEACGPCPPLLPRRHYQSSLPSHLLLLPTYRGAEWANKSDGNNASFKGLQMTFQAPRRIKDAIILCEDRWDANDVSVVTCNTLMTW